MLNYTSLQKDNPDKSLICIENRLKEEIKNLRKTLIEEEKKLYCIVMENLALEEAIKKFYSTYYMKKLGFYISILEDLKAKFWDKKTNTSKEEKNIYQEECDEYELKNIYRKLAKIYHPDRHKGLSEDEREFFEMRMSEANKYFEKKDIKSLKNMLEQAQIELSDEIPSLKRIEFLKMRISIIEELKKIYEKKIESLKNDEIYILMNMREEEREKEMEKRKELILSDIRLYISLMKTKKTSQKC